MRRFPMMDGLRAVAALSVLAYHAYFFAAIARVHAPGRAYFARLDVGVWIFFLISGFLLYRPFVRARLRAEPLPAVGLYAGRRFLRIVPAYWVALTVVALALGLTYVFQSATFYGFAQIYSPSDALRGIGQAWTLCVEVTFYAFLPLWALALAALSRRRAPRTILRIDLTALALLFVASVAYKWWATHTISPSSLANAPYLMPLPNYLDLFALGMMLATASAWYESRPPSRALTFVRARPWLPWLVSLVAFWAVSTRIGLTGELQLITPRQFVERHELYALVALGAILPAAFADPSRGLPGRVLTARPLALLGLVSYGIFLYHLFVIHELIDWLPRGWSLWPRLAAYGLLGVAGAAALGTLSYLLVERPAQRLGHRRRPRAPGPLVEPTQLAASTTSATSAGSRSRGTP